MKDWKDILWEKIKDEPYTEWLENLITKQIKTKIMDLKELSKQVYPDTEVEIKGKTYPYSPNLQRDGFVKGYGEAIEHLRECWKDAQYEMHKSFSSSYVGITFEQWLENKFKIKP